MRKLLLALSLASAVGVAQAATVGLNVERIKDTDTSVGTNVQHVHAATKMFKMDMNLNVRSQMEDKDFHLKNAELTLGKKLLKRVDVFAGLGHEAGFQGANADKFQYALVGAKTGMKLGPFDAHAGVKTRVNFDGDKPKQTHLFAGLAHPLTKAVTLHVNASKSYQDVKENAFSAGLSYKF